MASSSGAVPPALFYAKATPDNDTSSLPPQNPPFHQRLSSGVPQTSTSLYVHPAFIEAAVEMKGNFWGPVPVEDFFQELLKVDHPDLPQVDYEHLAAVSREESELKMYDPLIVAVKPFCKGIKLVNTSAVEDLESASGIFIDQCIKPDISIYAEDRAPQGVECITQAKLMIGSGEFKNDFRDEPFPYKHPFYSVGSATSPFEKDTLRARDTRGQLTVYANAIQTMQMRTHSFSFFINKNNCRLIHWSRSCAIVTEEFDYTMTHWLPKFFWCLSHGGDKLRGLDTTVAVVKDEVEARNACTALGLKRTSDPLYKIPVKDDTSTKTTYYIIHKPFTNNHIFPVGRGTRCFKAYDCQTGMVVLLKDTWRVLKYEREGTIYRDLEKAGVRHIAKLIAAGDVEGHTCGLTSAHFQSRARQDCAHPRVHVHIHYRIVLDIVGTPLTRFSSKWQMVNAMKCALIAHWDAVTKAKILHRDISSGNIIIIDGQGGILIDWELCKRITDDPVSATSHEKTIGTFQFISARLLMNKTLEHNVGDDLESFVHVLTWLAIKYARNGMTAQKRTGLLNRFDSTYGGEGGFDKSLFLSADISSVSAILLESQPLKAVLDDIYGAFGHRYDSVAQINLSTTDKAAAAAEVAKLETHDWLCGVMEEALKNEEWESVRDGRVDQPVIVNELYLMAGQEKRRKSTIPGYDEPKEDTGKREINKAEGAEEEIAQEPPTKRVKRNQG